MKNGTIEVGIHKGTAIRKDLFYYPYWHLDITDGKGGRVTINPSYEDLMTMLKEICRHELMVDVVIGRRREYEKWTEFLQQLNKITEQTLVEHFISIPPIIQECKKQQHDFKR